MADYQSSLPVRTQVDPDERLQVKLVDATTVSQQMTIDTDGNAHTEVHGNNPAGVDVVLRLSELGAVVPDGVYDATNNSDPGNVGLIGHARNTTPGDAQQNQRLTAIAGSVDTDVRALDVSLHDALGNAFSLLNPLPTFPAPSPGARVHDFDQAVSIAAAASANHDYLVSGNDFNLNSIECSASGKAKFELQTSPDGLSFTTFAVQFNSTANPNCTFDLTELPILVPDTGVVRVIKTNRDTQAQDLYSTIVGVLV